MGMPFSAATRLATASPRRAYMPLRPIGPRPMGRRWRRPKNSVESSMRETSVSTRWRSAIPGEVVDVPAQGHFLVGGAVDVVEQEAGQAAPGGAAEVGGGGDDHVGNRFGFAGGREDRQFVAGRGAVWRG